MPMLDIQRKFSEAYRIRLGDKSEKGAPRKLTDRIRITSASKPIVEAFVDEFGGDVMPWNHDGPKWQTYLPTTELDILVLPGQSLDQWWETYRGSVCERRCDGEVETLSGKPCMCPPDVAVRMKTPNACRPMTRINVIVPSVEFIGAGSLVTHGMIAAQTLPQSIMVAEAALRAGHLVPARLRIIEHRGKKHFIYPQIEIVGVSLPQLAAAAAQQGGPTALLGAGPSRVSETPAEIGPPPVRAIEAGSTPAPPQAAPKQRPRPPVEAPLLPGEEPMEASLVAVLLDRMQALPDAVRAGCKQRFVERFGRPDRLLAHQFDAADAFISGFEFPDGSGGGGPADTHAADAGEEPPSSPASSAKEAAPDTGEAHREEGSSTTAASSVDAGSRDFGSGEEDTSPDNPPAPPLEFLRQFDDAVKALAEKGVVVTADLLRATVCTEAAGQPSSKGLTTKQRNDCSKLLRRIVTGAVVVEEGAGELDQPPYRLSVAAKAAS